MKLCILGKVDLTAVRAVGVHWLNGNKDWYFVDFSEYDIPVGHIFSNGERLEEVQIQWDVSKKFPNGLPNIDRGWQTICRISNVKNVGDLPMIKSWTEFRKDDSDKIISKTLL